MSLPGLLIEYLITGAIAMIWIIYAIDAHQLFQIDNIHLFLLPAAYVLGMVIDMVAYGITYYPKEEIRKRTNKTFLGANKIDMQQEAKIRTKIQRKYRDINAELNMRNSRDRIARGMIVNSICVLIFVPEDLPISIKLSLLATSILAWVFFEHKSHKYFLIMYKQFKGKVRD